MHRHLMFPFPCAVRTVFKNEQGWPGTHDPQGALTICPGPWPRKGRWHARPPGLFTPRLNGCFYSHGHPEQVVRTKMSTEPTGLRPSAPVTSSHSQLGRMPRVLGTHSDPRLQPH